jgi:hypothetical protein
MLTADDLAGMQATQTAAMLDRCEIWTFAAGAVDAYGRPAPGWVRHGESVCGFDPRPGGREALGGAQAPLYDARLRLPLDTVIDRLARVRVTQRFGVAQGAPRTYELTGEPAAGPSGLVCRLQLVTTDG